MTSVLLFFLLLSMLVIGHELGHYLVARLFGVKADEFGFGFPPRLFGVVKVGKRWKWVRAQDRKKYAQTIWSLNMLPLGGFVRLKGEDEVDARDPDAFMAQSPLRRFCILAAGVAVNWLLAALIFIVGLTIGVPSQLEDLPNGAIVEHQRLQITQVMHPSAAMHAGIQPGDFLLTINQRPVSAFDQAQPLLAAAATTHQAIDIIVDRQGKLFTLHVVPEFVPSLHRLGLGIAMADTGTVRLVWWRAIPQGIRVTWHYELLIITTFGDLMRNVVLHRTVSADVSGPVGIAVITGKIARQGLWSLFQFAAMLSINLAVVNALPIPALDGGRMFFVILEGLRQRQINQRLEASLHRVGFVFLLSLIGLVTLKDLHQYGGAIIHGFQQLFGG